MRSKLDIGLELLIYDCGTGHCSGIIRILTVYLRKYTQSMVAILESLAVLNLWVWLDVIRPMRSKVDIGLELLIYDYGIGHCSGVIRILTVYLRKYTQSMVAILYTVESLEVLCVWAWLSVIRSMRSKLDIGLLIYDCGVGHCSGIFTV